MLKVRQKRILVIGAGAIGGVISGFLARNGFDIHLVTKYENIAERISTTGIRITGIKGSFTFPIPSVAKIDEAKGLFDFVIMATKAYDLRQPLLEALEKLTPNGKIVLIQNGIVEEEVADIAGKDKVIGCVVGWGATLIEPGAMEMTSDGEFVIGELSGNPTNEVLEIQEILNRVLKTYVVNNIYDHLYSKLIINMCVTTLGAISGYNVGSMLNRRRYRHLIVSITREAIEVANAMQLKIPLYAGKLNYYNLCAPVNFLQSVWKHAVMQLFGWKYKRLKSSSLQSLERKKATEIDYINGFVVKKGAELGIATPLNAILVQYIHEIENKQRTISPENFKQDIFKPFFPKHFIGL